MKWIDKFSGESVLYDDEGNKTTLNQSGVTVEEDSAYSQSDMDDYRAGRINEVEYRRRYNARFRGQG